MSQVTYQVDGSAVHILRVDTQVGVDYGNTGRAILELIAASLHPKPSEWQLIETAPKDKPILGYKDWPVAGLYDCHTVFWSKDFGWCQLGGDERHIPVWQPTHWMPLSAGPANDNEELSTRKQIA